MTMTHQKRSHAGQGVAPRHMPRGLAGFESIADAEHVLTWTGKLCGSAEFSVATSSAGGGA